MNNHTLLSGFNGPQSVEPPQFLPGSSPTLKREHSVDSVAVDVFKRIHTEENANGASSLVPRVRNKTPLEKIDKCLQKIKIQKGTNINYKERMTARLDQISNQLKNIEHDEDEEECLYTDNCEKLVGLYTELDNIGRALEVMAYLKEHSSEYMSINNALNSIADFYTRHERMYELSQTLNEIFDLIRESSPENFLDEVYSVAQLFAMLLDQHTKNQKENFLTSEQMVNKTLHEIIRNLDQFYHPEPTRNYQPIFTAFGEALSLHGYDFNHQQFEVIGPLEDFEAILGWIQEGFDSIQL